MRPLLLICAVGMFGLCGVRRRLTDETETAAEERLKVHRIHSNFLIAFMYELRGRTLSVWLLCVLRALPRKARACDASRRCARA
jgi:hypothetical protein